VYGPELAPWVEKHHKRLEESNLLFMMQSGQRAGIIQFRGRAIHGGEAEKLFKELQEEIERDHKTKADFDARMLTAHLALARHGGMPEQQEMERRYRFHMVIQNMHKEIMQGMNDVHATLNFAGSRGELSPQEFADVKSWLNQAVAKLQVALEDAQKHTIPALKNMSDGQSLGGFLLPKQLILGLLDEGQSIDGLWVQRLLAQLGEVQDKLARLLFKSMGGILALQERIVAGFQQNATTISAPSP
ncbi:MAG: hypothetical protein L0215_00615, partial [Gemmataceae bacterium]|nr:hypothetical protein [Gemmataceae bacterium]